MAHTTRVSHLRNAWLVSHSGYPDQGSPGAYIQKAFQGKLLDNQIPIIVLVDDTCGSAGESMLNYLRGLDNVIIVGSNSAGYQLCGNQSTMWLPYSKITFAFGSSLMFHFTDENVDYRGYMPDVWCNPADALEAVLNMLVCYDLTDSATCQSLLADPRLQKPVNLTIRWQDVEILPDNRFGSIMDNDVVRVYANGEPVTDFTVTSHAPELLETAVSSDGTLSLNRLRSFNGTPVDFTITYNEQKFDYQCVDSTWAPE